MIHAGARLFAIAALSVTALVATVANAKGIRIDSPDNGATLYDVRGTVTVEAELSEADLASTMRFTLLLDGQPVKEGAFLPFFVLNDVAAGPHVLELEVMADGAQVMEKSDPVHFVLRRAAAAQEEGNAQ